MKQYETFELSFEGEEPKGSFALADIKAVFTLGDESKTVNGFYDGKGIYKVRFLPAKLGTYSWKVSGVVSAEGIEECVPSEKSHGIVRADGFAFKYEDGEKYIPFGTTVYAIAHQDEALIEETFQTLEKTPFNKLRHCIFPKSYDFNHNDPKLYPFEKNENGKWDVNRPCFEFWQNFENIVKRLGYLGIQSDIILMHSYDRWGFAFLDMSEIEIYLDYALRRLSAFPFVWWSMANEYDFLFNRSLDDWYKIEEIIVKNDPYRHLLSNHNGMKIYDFSRQNITHCSIQTNAMHKVSDWRQKYGKPVVIDECCYEGDLEHEWGSITAFEMVNRFWQGFSLGGYVTHGETYYSDDEILWWAKGGKLHGESAPRIAFLKDLMYSFKGNLEPWNEPIFEEFGNVTEKAVKSDVPPFFKLMASLSTEESENLKWKSAAYLGHIGDDVFLKYYGTHRPKKAAFRLPKDFTYKIEVIDAWEMTRKTLAQNVSGRVPLDLPGKEGIAVLATRIN